MTYRGITDLSRNMTFRDRLSGVLVEQAKVKFTPETPGVDSWLAAAIVQAPDYWTNNWSFLVAAEPGFASDYEGPGGADSISDERMQSAVQSLWHTVALIWQDTLNPEAPVTAAAVG